MAKYQSKISSRPRKRLQKSSRKTRRQLVNTINKPLNAGLLAVLVILSIFAGYVLTHNSHASSALIFDDEFNGPAGAAPDPSKWQILGGATPERWGFECFVNDRKHLYLDGQGHLVETATYNPGGVPCRNGSGPYESGGVDTGAATNGLFDYKYGTAQASIKVPCQSGTGLWPAWWSDGPKWPAGGEIDMLEVMKGGGPDDAHQTLHGATTSGGHWNLGHANLAPSPWCNNYHTYGVQWSPSRVAFTIDGTVTHAYTPASMKSGWIWPFNSAQERLLLDLQVGGVSGGTVNNSTLPQSMLIDWVRVYAQGSSPAPTPTPSPTPKPSPSPTPKPSQSPTPTPPPASLTGDFTGPGSMCLDNYHSRAVNGNKIQLWKCNNTGAQRWTVEPYTKTQGVSRIVNSNGMCLDVRGAGTAIRTLVWLYTCNGTVAQDWRVNTSTGTITNPHSGLCLDDRGDRAILGNEIWIYTCNGTGAQKWTFHRS